VYVFATEANAVSVRWRSIVLHERIVEKWESIPTNIFFFFLL